MAARLPQILRARERVPVSRYLRRRQAGNQAETGGFESISIDARTFVANRAKIALVTGGNRGIGLETCRQLGRLGYAVLLTSRNSDAGEKAAASLRSEGLDVKHGLLDVTDPVSIASCAERAEAQFGALHVLINNAGIMRDSSKHGASIFDARAPLLRDTFDTNTLGPLQVAQAFVPLMRKAASGRIVNVSSGMGQLTHMDGQYPGYRISKAALNAVTRILACELEDTNIKVNSACPGWVRTDMGGPGAPRSPAEGADTVVWLATLPDDGPNGGFFRDRKPIDW